jgi:Cdc6-like AAA superfamily ATPase
MTITTKMIETRLKELLTCNQPFGIAINGKWGVGKTVFWNKFVEENFSDKSKNGKK